VAPLTQALQDSAHNVVRSAQLALSRLASESPNDPELIQAVRAAFERHAAGPRNLAIFLARSLLQSAFRSGAAVAGEMLDLVESRLPDPGGLWDPYVAALEYLRSDRNPAVLERQQPEMREAIELLVGGSGPTRLAASSDPNSPASGKMAGR